MKILILILTLITLISSQVVSLEIFNKLNQSKEILLLDSISKITFHYTTDDTCGGYWPSIAMFTINGNTYRTNTLSKLAFTDEYPADTIVSSYTKSDTSTSDSIVTDTSVLETIKGDTIITDSTITHTNYKTTTITDSTFIDTLITTNVIDTVSDTVVEVTIDYDTIVTDTVISDTVIYVSDIENYKNIEIKTGVDISPNPFNPVTAICFGVENKSNVKISIHSINGKLVENITNTVYSRGMYVINWNANKFGLASGTYLLHTEIENKVFNKKILLIK